MRSISYLVLHNSASLGREDQVRELILGGHPLNLRDSLGRTPLYSCVDAYRNCFEKQEKPILACVELLLEAGADLMITSKLGYTALDSVVLHGVPLNRFSCEMSEETKGELCYSPHGMDENKSCKKMGELIKLFLRYCASSIVFGDPDFSWLTNYAMLDQPIDECLAELFGILEIKPKHIVDVILLRTLMGVRALRHFLITAVKHGVHTNMNLYAMREPYTLAHLLIELKNLTSVKRIQNFANFSRTPIGNLTIDVYEYLEGLCEKDKAMISYMMQIFKTLKRCYQLNYSKYLSLLMRLRSANSIALIDLKEGLFNYVQMYNKRLNGNFRSYVEKQKHQEGFQNSLIKVYLFIIVWVDHRPEDFNTGVLLRGLFENKFEAYYSLHYLIQLPNTKEYGEYLTSFLEPEEERRRVLDSEGLRLIDSLINQALNRSSEGFRTSCDGGTALHFAAASGNIELLTFLIREKDVYLYAIDNRYQTFIDILQATERCVSDEDSKAQFQSIIEFLKPVMLLKPLKTLSAETIIKHDKIWQFTKTQLKDHHPLKKFINLHLCPEDRSPSKV